MAKEYYGLNRGETEFATLMSATTTGKDIEVVIDLSKNLTRAEVLMALEMIENAIIKGNWPPA